METVTLRAHYDGTQIRLDDPFELKPEMELLVTVKYHPLDEESDDWMQLSIENLARTYGEDEPDYASVTLADPGNVAGSATDVAEEVLQLIEENRLPEAALSQVEEIEAHILEMSES